MTESPLTLTVPLTFLALASKDPAGESSTETVTPLAKRENEIKNAITGKKRSFLIKILLNFSTYKQRIKYVKEKSCCYSVMNEFNSYTKFNIFL